LLAVVDVFGQVALFDRTGGPLCMFLALNGKVAGWLPDGTRLGPAALTGGPRSDRAEDAFGQALAAASRGGSGR
jgi:hypothetical protein